MKWTAFKNVFLVVSVVLVGAGIYFTLTGSHLRLAFDEAVHALPLAVSPGELSNAHSFLQGDCAACHASNGDLSAAKCISCHSNDTTLLQRQPTAFHANITTCRPCHAEHRGRQWHPIQMDHDALAAIALRQIRENKNALPEDRLATEQMLVAIVRGNLPGAEKNPHLNGREAALDCAVCHQTKDHHFGLFGSDCAACHSTQAWTIPEFKHPSATSFDCAQCHQAPPSHYMGCFLGCFRMVSMTVAGQMHARVDQCYLCHQTTSWNDIKGIGFSGYLRCCSFE